MPNLVIAPIGPDGAVSFYNGSAGTTHLVADIFGYVIGGAPPAAGGLVTLTPARLMDTRADPGRDAVGPGDAISLPIGDSGGVPDEGVSAVVLNVTVTQPTGFGYLTVYGSGTERPTASNLNFLPAQTIANLVVVPVGPTGGVDLYNGSAGTTHVIADVVGYITAGAPTARGTLASLAPSRILDTRQGLGGVQSQGSLTLNIEGKGGLPYLDIAAVILTVTATQPAGFGYVSVFGDGPLPSASNLNYVEGQTIPNLVIAPVSSAGTVTLYNGGTGDVHLIADVAGYVLASDPPTWHAPTSIMPAHGAPTGISCPVGTDFCVAVDAAGAVMQYDGTTWSTPAVIDDALPSTLAESLAPGLRAVSCASATFCVALDRTRAFVFDGDRWSGPTIIGGALGMTAISCTTATFCMAVDGSTGHGFRFDGTNWSEPMLVDRPGPGEPSAQLTGIACQRESFCTAVDSGGRLLHYIADGPGWYAREQTLPDAKLLAVSCGPSIRCFAIDSIGRAYTFLGRSWTVDVATGPGPVWSAAAASISCPTSTDCLAVDDQGQTRTYGAGTWGPVTPRATQNAYAGVSCRAAAECQAITAQGNVLTLGAAAAAATTLVDPIAGVLVGVSCPQPGECAAIDSAGNTATSSGGAWSAAAAAPLTSVAAIDCTSPSRCVALTEFGNASTLDGGSWSEPIHISPPSSPGAGSYGLAVSCAAPTFCVAAGYGSNGSNDYGWTATYDGTGWTAPSVTIGSPWFGVSCAGTGNFCMVAGRTNTSYTTGAAWAPGPGYPQPPGITTLGCASPAFCVLLDDTGARTFDGTSWAAPVQIADFDFPATRERLAAISCASSAFCAATSASPAGGQILTYSTTGWSAPHPVDASGLTAIDCPRDDYCLAVDARGRAVVYS